MSGLDGNPSGELMRVLLGVCRSADTATYTVRPRERGQLRSRRHDPSFGQRTPQAVAAPEA
jgi:hypothetical protein